MTLAHRLNARYLGAPDAPPILFVHGFGCDQSMWRHVAPAFAADHRVITIDLVGAGGSDVHAWDPQRYSTLHGYADDLVQLLGELDLRRTVLVGHSVSAMIIALTQLAAPDRVGHLVMIGPSPRYIDTDGYVGGFSQDDVEGLLDSLASNYLGWSATMAPVIVGNADRPELGQELSELFCRMDPDIARVFARTTFLSDVRHVLPQVTAPTLVLQCRDDVIAPDEVGRYVADQLPHSTFVQMAATGHCPNLSAPGETTSLIRDYLERAASVPPALV